MMIFFLDVIVVVGGGDDIIIIIIFLSVSNPSDVIIPIGELHFFEVLGKGTSAIVYRG